jgi:hypothetical protein
MLLDVVGDQECRINLGWVERFPLVLGWLTRPGGFVGGHRTMPDRSALCFTVVLRDLFDLEDYTASTVSRASVCSPSEPTN